MYIAIYFYGEFASRAVKVENERPYGVLRPKLEAT